MKSATLAATLAATLLFVPIAGAQGITDGSPFTLTVSPSAPTPFSTVTITPTSGALDLSTATMTVSVNGKQTYEGNAQPTAVTLGKGGASTSVRVTMRAGIQNVSRTIVITPQEISLVTEPLSSAPSLYLGKTAVPIEGKVRFVAVTNFRTATGKTVSPSSLSYVWTIDGTLMTAESGVGKNSLIVGAPLQYRSRSVSVAVQTIDGALQGSASASFSADEPFLRLYENDPLLGVRFERALSDSYDTAESEASLYASPFGFSLANGLAAVEWFMNGSSVQSGNLISLRPAADGKGSANISAVASTANDLRATEQLSVSFGPPSILNIFGL